MSPFINELTVRIGLLCVISGFGGSLLSALFIQLNISIGASGAVFGLLGGMLSEIITNWTIYSNKFGWVSQRYAPLGYSSTSAKAKFKMYQLILCVISQILLIIGTDAKDRSQAISLGLIVNENELYC
ncbi:hypothetical protein L1049_014021 [Liquidambar formosana]|uniref:RHOMBOID-like protein n=1 Tax=Liquidambar formosana TaxID=63359 RepID=A0AAP0RMQ0_LIQFO